MLEADVAVRTLENVHITWPDLPAGLQPCLNHHAEMTHLLAQFLAICWPQQGPYLAALLRQCFSHPVPTFLLELMTSSCQALSHQMVTAVFPGAAPLNLCSQIRLLPSLFWNRCPSSLGWSTLRLGSSACVRVGHHCVSCIPRCSPGFTLLCGIAGMRIWNTFIISWEQFRWGAWLGSWTSFIAATYQLSKPCSETS